MLTHGRRFVLVLLILCFLPLPACSSGNVPFEESRSPERTASLEEQSAELTQSEHTLAPPTITSPPPITETETPTQTQGAISRGEMYSVTDEFNAVEYFIPNAWSEYDVSPWLIDGQVIGSSISASSDLNAYQNWGAAGVSIYISRRLDKGYLQMMDEFRHVYAESCDEYPQTWNYENDIHRGRRQRFWYCGGEDGPTLDLVALVNKDDWQAYTAIVVIVWEVFNDVYLNEDILLNFLVIPENLP